MTDIELNETKFCIDVNYHLSYKGFFLTDYCNVERTVVGNKRIIFYVWKFYNNIHPNKKVFLSEVFNKIPIETICNWVIELVEPFAIKNKIKIDDVNFQITENSHKLTIGTWSK